MTLLIVCVAVLSACAGAMIALLVIRLPRWRIGPTPTLDEAIEEAIKEQVANERALARVGIHFWSQQRERAILQRIERRIGKVPTPTMAAYVHHRVMQVEVVNLSPHKPK